MIIKSSSKPNKYGAAIFEGEFFDSKNNAVTPKEASYSLFDGFGGVINGIKNKELTELDTTYAIPLSCEDMDIPNGDKLMRRFVLDYIYDSDIGSDICDNIAIEFFMEDIPGYVKPE